MQNKIIGIVVALLLIGGIGYGVYTKQHPGTVKPLVETTNDVPVPEQSGEKQTPSVVTTEKAAPLPKVNIQLPERPVNGKYKGVIEVGASGFNCFVVNIDAEKHWEQITAKYGKSFAVEGLATVSAVQEKLEDYLSEILNKGADPRNVHFVMSSGALKLKNSQTIADGITKKGYIVNRVTADQEGKFGAKAVIQPMYRNSSYIVDIGSGNTKITWYEGSAMKSLEGPGAKYFQTGELHKTDQEAYDLIKKIASQVPEENRKLCFVIGGVPYNLADKVRDGKERYTTLDAPDSYSYGDDLKLKSGLNIYSAIIDATGTSTFVFDWDANFTIGFLLSLN